MAGFIVLEDGRAYAASNFATNAMLRAISREVDDAALKAWLLSQQSQYVGMGLTSVDLREVAPRYRPVMRAAICQAYERVISQGFENLRPRDSWWTSWLTGFRDLVETVARSEAGEAPESFNPHMRGLLPPTGRQRGPGWDDLQ